MILLYCRNHYGVEIRDLNTDVIHDCPRLAKVRSLVTSDGEGDRLFDLTKGPPGTGKTQTILALLSAILHAVPARVKARVSLLDIKQKPKLRNQEKFNHWRLASPWLSGNNPRVKTMPVNGDDGFFPKRSWHEYRCFGPFCFFDLHEGKEAMSEASGSWVNADEVEFVLNLYHKLVSRYPELKSSNYFAIISPYRAQVDLLKERFKSTFGVDSEKEVEITTVDGCQGREKDVAIFSCVRASKKGGIGHVENFRRMNVGITRAKASVLVSKPYAAFFSDESLESMRTGEEIMPSGEVQNDELDYSMPTYTVGDADEGQGDDNGYGDGDEMDVDDGGFGDD
ncbi:hypothetical protein ACLB2K_025388 [Fragaria x ananassa]